MPTKKSTTAGDAVVASLNRQQANALVGYLNYKKYHWLTFGPTFRDLHLLFEDHAIQIHAMLDELAERALTIDGQPIADPERYLTVAKVTPSRGAKTPDAMVKEAIATSESVIDQMHADAETATKAGDIGTADLFTRLVQVVEKQRWFLKQLVRKRDGLTG